MTCDNFTQWISAALDGELTAEQRRELDVHLAHCPDCAALYEMLSANSRAMRELDCEFPEGLHDRIMNNLPPQEAPKQHKVIPWRRWGSLAACLAVVVALGTLIGIHGLPMGASRAPTAAEMSPTSNESPVAPGEGPDISNYSKSDGAGHSGETESAAPVVSGTEAPSSETIAPAAKPSDNGSSFGDRPVVSAAPSFSFQPIIGELTGAALPNVQYIRASYGSTPAPSAVVISSADSLANYLMGFGSGLKALEALPGTYTDAFFTDHCLVAVVVESGSGSTRYEALSVQNDIVTIRTIVPEMGTCDMAAWLILIELDEMLDDGSILEIKFTH